MWKKETESVTRTTAAAATKETTRERPQKASRTPPVPVQSANLGRTVVVKGELSANEDVRIDGTVEGTVDVSGHVLTIGPSGKVRADIRATTIVVEGTVRGNVTALEKIDLRANGSIDGDLVAPRVAMAEGSHFRGSIDMNSASHLLPSLPKTTATPAIEAPARRAAVAG